MIPKLSDTFRPVCQTLLKQVNVEELDDQFFLVYLYYIYHVGF